MGALRTIDCTKLDAASFAELNPEISPKFRKNSVKFSRKRTDIE